jgi:hypothetical protein
MGWLPPPKFFTDTLAHFTVAVGDEKNNVLITLALVDCECSQADHSVDLSVRFSRRLVLLRSNVFRKRHFDERRFDADVVRDDKSSRRFGGEKEWKREEN